MRPGKPKDLPHVSRAKNVAKQLQRTVKELRGERFSIQRAQNVTVRLLGYRDWHHLERSPSFIYSTPDEELSPELLETRRMKQFHLLAEAFPDLLREYGADLLQAVVISLRATAKGYPRTLKKAAAEGDELAARFISEDVQD